MCQKAFSSALNRLGFYDLDTLENKVKGDKEDHETSNEMYDIHDLFKSVTSLSTHTSYADRTGIEIAGIHYCAFSEEQKHEMLHLSTIKNRISSILDSSENSLGVCFECYKFVMNLPVMKQLDSSTVSKKESVVNSFLSAIENLSFEVRRIFALLMEAAKYVWVEKEKDLVRDCIDPLHRHIKEQLSILFCKLFCKKKLSRIELKNLFVYRDILFLMLSISPSTVNHDIDVNFAEACNYLSYYFADSFYDNERKNGLPLPEWILQCAKNGLSLSNPQHRQDAFNTLGLCAIQTIGQKQLAYDTYYSWLTMNVDILNKEQGLSLEASLFDEDEALWRNTDKGKKHTSTMHANLSYVCGVIADSYERENSERWQAFIFEAIYHIECAIEKQEHPSYFCTYGTLLSDLIDPTGKALVSINDTLLTDQPITFLTVVSKYKEYYDLVMKEEWSVDEKITALRCIIETLLDDLVAQLINWYTSETNTVRNLQGWLARTEIGQCYTNILGYLKEYRSLLEDSGAEKKNNKEHSNWLDFFAAFDAISQSEDSVLKRNLLTVWHLSQHLQKLLRRREYSTKNYFLRKAALDKNIKPERKVEKIAYYTTLPNVVHLFDVMYRDNHHSAPRLAKADKKEEVDNGLNCLTMMHARYMNDPLEGLALAESVNREKHEDNIIFYQGDFSRFRDETYHHNFIFLKSFTKKEDRLHMWNRYGSDRSHGSRDSNGCYVEFDSDFFDRINDSALTKVHKLLDEMDDYYLYRVLYISRDGNLRNDSNTNSLKWAHNAFCLLTTLLEETNSLLRTFLPNNDIVDHVRQFLQHSLCRLMFLIKYDDYADEEEWRLIETRSYDELETIRMLSNTPGLLCINPFFQICINKIILGPNTIDEARWITYFQYELIKMRNRSYQNEKKDDIVSKFYIEKSKINYHT